MEDVDGTGAAYQRGRPVRGQGDRAPETMGARAAAVGQRGRRRRGGGPRALRGGVEDVDRTWAVEPVALDSGGADRRCRPVRGEGDRPSEGVLCATAGERGGGRRGGRPRALRGGVEDVGGPRIGASTSRLSANQRRRPVRGQSDRPSEGVLCPTASQAGGGGRGGRPRALRGDVEDIRRARSLELSPRIRRVPWSRPRRGPPTIRTSCRGNRRWP